MIKKPPFEILRGKLITEAYKRGQHRGYKRVLERYNKKINPINFEKRLEAQKLLAFRETAAELEKAQKNLDKLNKDPVFKALEEVDKKISLKKRNERTKAMHRMFKRKMTKKEYELWAEKLGVKLK